jgi:hypothetical protein
MHPLARAVLLTASSAAVAHADPMTWDSGPHAGRVGVEVSLPNDFTLAPGGTLIGAGGVGVGLTYRAAEGLLLGVTADVEAMVATTFATDDSPGTRWRAGVESRYYFGARPRLRQTPLAVIPWFGVRSGYETLDGGATHGYYGDLSLGGDMWIGQQQVGVYVSAGLSVEPLAVYGSTAPTSPASPSRILRTSTHEPASDLPTTSAPYVVIGWRYAFR